MRPRTESRFRVEEIRSVDSFRELGAEWDDLCERAIEVCPTMRHAFLLGWLHAFGEGLDLRILLVREGEQLVAAAPFAQRAERLFGRHCRVLGFVSNTWIDRSLLLLARADSSLLDAILGHVAGMPEEADLLSLGPLGSASEAVALVRERAVARGWRQGEEVSLESPFLDLPASWHGLLERLSPAFRATLRRKLRYVERMPEVTMRIADDASCWEAIAAISPLTWQADAGTALTSRPELSRFYEGFVRDAARRGALRCGLLEVDGVPVAFDLNVLERDVLYSFKMGFKQEHAALSAGVVLKAHVLRSAIGEGALRIRGYDFMGTAEPYKLHWTPLVRGYERHFLFAPGLRNAGTHFVHFALRPLLRERLPGLWSTLKRLRGAK